MRLSIAGALVAAIVSSHSRIGSLLKASEPSTPGFLPTAEGLKLVSLGYDQIAADVYWLAFVQYVGDVEGRKKDRYSLAHQYLDLVTGLDPGFVAAYWFAAFVLGGDLAQPAMAAQLIDRGLQANQDNWTIPYIAGVNQYLFAHNEVQAAKYYREAAKFPKAPDWLLSQADVLAARIPSAIKQIHVWDSIYHSTTDPLVKEKARVTLIREWNLVYARSPSAAVKERAAKALKELGAQF